MKTRAERIRYLREALGKDQGQFAALLGVSVPSLRNWERTSKELGIKRHNLNLIARATGTTIDWIEYGRGEAPVFNHAPAPINEAVENGTATKDILLTDSLDIQSFLGKPEIQFAREAMGFAIEAAYAAIGHRPPTEGEKLALLRTCLEAFAAHRVLTRFRSQLTNGQIPSAAQAHIAEQASASASRSD